MAEIRRDEHRSEIVRLEEQIDRLDAKIENCRKFILSGRITVASGGSVLIAIVVGAIQFDPAVMGLAIAAVLGGIVVTGSNWSTAKQAADELSAAETERSALIGKLELRAVHDYDG